jgi:hypothetical protein
MDSSITGTLTNGPVYSSNNNGYFSLDGVNDYIITSSLFNPTTFPNLTQILWFYPTSAGQIVCELGQSTINSAWHDSNIEISSGGIISFSIWHGSLTNKVTSSAQSFNKWYQLALTYSGTTCTAYINGSSIGNTSFTRSTTSALYYGIGATDSTNMGTAGYAGGRVSIFMVYQRALTSDEILNNYNAHRGRFGLV